MNVVNPPVDESTQIIVTELKHQNEELGNKIEVMEGHLSKLVCLINELHEKLTESKKPSERNDDKTEHVTAISQEEGEKRK